MQTNQFYSSGKTAYKSQLEKEFSLQKIEIYQSTELSETEKTVKITSLEKTFLRKKRRLDYFNF